MPDINDLHPRYVTDVNGEATSVVLSIKEFDALLEDIADLVAVAERRDDSTITHERLLDELGREGIV